MAETTKEPSKKTLNDDDLTSRAIEEIFREVHVAQIRSREFGSTQWAACPLRKTNKRFLSSTLRNVETHNKRHLDRIQKSSNDKLQEIPSKLQSSRSETYCRRKETKQRRRSYDSDTNESYRGESRRRRRLSRDKEHYDYREHTNYESQPLAPSVPVPHPAQMMYYYPPQMLPQQLQVKPEKKHKVKSKKLKRTASELRKKGKSKSKNKDNLEEFIKRKLRKKKRKSKRDKGEPDDCFEVVDLSD